MINSKNIKHWLKRDNKHWLVILSLCVIMIIILYNILNINILNSGVTIDEDIKDIESLYLKGKDLMRTGRHDSALMVLTAVGKLAENGTTTDDTILAVKAYNNAGVISFYNKNYSEAYSFYKKAIQAGGDRHAYWVYNNIAIILSLFHDYSKALHLTTETYREARSTNEWGHLNNAYYNLLNLGFLNNCIDSIDSIMLDYNTLPLPADNNTAFLKEVTAGMQLYKNKKYLEAISKFMIADSLSSQSRLPQRAKIDCNMYIAKVFLSNNQQDSALMYLHNAAELSESQEMGDYTIEIYNKIIECYLSMNRASDANAYRRKYYQLRDSLSTINDMTVSANLEKNYEIEKYEEQIAKVVSERKEFYIWLISACLVLALTIVFLIITWVQKQKLQTANIGLFNKNLELLKVFEEEKHNHKSIKGKVQAVDTPAVGESIEDNAMPDQKDLSNVSLPATEQERIKEAIMNFFYGSTEYLSADFNQRRLCEIVGSNRLYVSYVINKVLGTTFHGLLNEYRINEAKIRLLDDERYGNMTVEAIAESVGYRSRSNFTMNFKKNTGLTTSEFLAIAKSTSKNNSHV